MLHSDSWADHIHTCKYLCAVAFAARGVQGHLHAAVAAVTLHGRRKSFTASETLKMVRETRTMAERIKRPLSSKQRGVFIRLIGVIRERPMMALARPGITRQKPRTRTSTACRTVIAQTCIDGVRYPLRFYRKPGFPASRDLLHPAWLDVSTTAFFNGCLTHKHTACAASALCRACFTDTATTTSSDCFAGLRPLSSISCGERSRRAAAGWNRSCLCHWWLLATGSNAAADDDRNPGQRALMRVIGNPCCRRVSRRALSSGVTTPQWLRIFRPVAFFARRGLSRAAFRASLRLRDGFGDPPGQASDRDGLCSWLSSPISYLTFSTRIAYQPSSIVAFAGLSAGVTSVVVSLASVVMRISAHLQVILRLKGAMLSAL